MSSGVSFLAYTAGIALGVLAVKWFLQAVGGC